MSSKSISKGTKVWLGRSFRAEGQSIAGEEAEVVSAYSENKVRRYVVRHPRFGLLHGRYEDFIVPDKSRPESCQRPNWEKFKTPETV